MKRENWNQDNKSSADSHAKMILILQMQKLRIMALQKYTVPSSCISSILCKIIYINNYECKIDNDKILNAEEEKKEKKMKTYFWTLIS